MALENIPNLTIQYNEPLAKFTAARLGGNADILAIARDQQALLQAVLWAYEEKMPWLILGGGANVLISDLGVRGFVIINHAKNSNIDADTGIVMAESGVNITSFARRCMSKGLKGLEWGVSVPGTIGGQSSIMQGRMAGTWQKFCKRLPSLI